MAELSKITLPDGNNYDLKVYTNHIAPMMTKTFTGVIGTANNFADATFYFGSIIPDNDIDIWKIKYRVSAEATGQAASKGYYEVECSCVGASFIAYKVFNFQKNTSYRPLYNHVIYRAKIAGITSGYGHLLGERLYSSWNATTAANARTFKLEIVECVNCTFTFFDTPVKYANAPGTGSTNYDNYTEFNGTTQGITRTGTDNNDVNYQNRIYYSASNAIKTYAAGGRYTLNFSKNDHYILPITSTDNVTNGGAHTYTTESFNPFGEIYYRSSSSAIAANVAVGNATLYRQVYVDARYSFTGVLNGASSVMSAGKPVYIICTPQLDGSAKLHSEPLGFELPTSEDGLMYILLGYAYNTYQFELLIHHPVYMYKNGAIRVLTGMSQYAENSAMVNGHTVEKNVPSDAVFTDTTYSLATTTTNGLMSSTDKIKLGRIGSSYDSTTETIVFELDDAPSIDHLTSTSDFRVQLLQAFQNVAWLNGNGSNYYNNLMDALYPTTKYITAVFTQPSTFIYTDDGIDSLKDYLIVTYYASETSSGTVLSDSDYVLSGTLVGGTNTITVTFLNVSTTFTVNNVIDIFNNYVWTWGTTGNHLLAKLNGQPAFAVVTDTRGAIHNENASLLTTRRGFTAQKGIYQLESLQTHEPIGEYYPIPIPPLANKITITVTPSTMTVIGRMGKLSNGNFTSTQNTANTAGSTSLTFTAGEDQYVLPSVYFDSSGSTFTSEPTSLTIVFEET